MSYDSPTTKLLMIALQSARDVVWHLQRADSAMQDAVTSTGALYLCADERGEWDLSPILSQLEVTLANAVKRRDQLEGQWSAACQAKP